MRHLLFIVQAMTFATVRANPLPQVSTDTLKIALANKGDLGDSKSIRSNAYWNLGFSDPSDEYGINQDMSNTISRPSQEGNLGVTVLSISSKNLHDASVADSSADLVNESLAIASDHLPDSVDSQATACWKSQSNTKRSTDKELLSSYN